MRATSRQRKKGWQAFACAAAWVLFAPIAWGVTLATGNGPANPGFVMSGDYESFGEQGRITKGANGYQWARGGAHEAALLRFFATDPMFSSGKAVPVSVNSKLLWSGLAMFEVSVNQTNMRTTTAPLFVRCSPECAVDRDIQTKLSRDDSIALSFAFEYFGDAPRENVLTGRENALQKYLFTWRFVMPELAGSSANPLVFRVDARDLPLNGGRPVAYNFETGAWRGQPTAAAKHLADFIIGLRAEAQSKARVAGYLNRTFVSSHADRLRWRVNRFDQSEQGLLVQNTFVSAQEFAQQAAKWQSFVPLASVMNGDAIFVIFSTSEGIGDIQVMPVRCKAEKCQVVEEDWLSFASSAIQRPPLLKLYYGHYRKRIKQ